MVALKGCRFVMSPGTKIDTTTDVLRQRIVKGEFGTAGRLPSLRLLAEEYGTTHEITNKAIQRLLVDGIKQGRKRLCKTASCLLISRGERI
jgi:DNA-binding FadR family transcriptional regulator